MTQSSPPLHAPSPQVVPQSSGHVAVDSSPPQKPLPHVSHWGQSAAASFVASAAHTPSQEVSQQNASSAHTAAWHARSSQPIVTLSSQQLPSHPPQSASQVTQSSRPLHAPSPQLAPQSSGQDAVDSPPLQAPSPHASPQSSGHVAVDSPGPQKPLPHVSHCGQSAGMS